MMYQLQTNKGYYCHICEKKFELRSKNNNPKSLIHIQYEKCIPIEAAYKKSRNFWYIKSYDWYINHK